MHRWIVMLAGSCMSTVMLYGTAMAQDQIYRCGNEYTNNATIAEQRNCQVVEGGHVTVVHTDSPRSGSKPSASADSKPSPNRAAKVDPVQQESRDSDARSILQAELERAQQRLQALQEEYNGGNPVKTALELRNPQVYMERLEALKANIARQEADIAGIQRELSRHKGN